MNEAKTSQMLKQDEKNIYFNLWETLGVIGITIILFIFFRKLGSVIAGLPALYLLIDKLVRRRSWISVGFNIKDTFSDIKKYILIFMLPVLMQVATGVVAKAFLPEFISHVKGRVPVKVEIVIAAIITIFIGTFLEEVIYRGFIQNRLSRHTGNIVAIIFSSLLFAFMHFSAGEFSIVAFDISTIFIDSIFYGYLFAKTKNLYASWAAHCIADFCGLIVLLLL